MKVRLVPSAVAPPQGAEPQHLTSYVIDDTMAIDAGCIGFFGTADDQARIKHVLISHTHIDHLASLPIFVENAYEGGPDCVTIYGNHEVLECLRRDLFNGRVWPDFLRLAPPEAPFFKLQLLEAGKPIVLPGKRITPIAVDHAVPTLGFLVEDASAAVLFVSDTGPTHEIWEHARRTPNLRAVFLEAAFPNDLEWLAEISKHLTPARFAREVAKLQRPVPIYAVHLKARYRDQIAKELEALHLPGLEIARFDRPYLF